MLIVFYDVTTPLVYTDKTRIETGLGGTEATITRIAHALADQHTVVVAQHCRTVDQDTISNGVRYVALETANTLSPDAVILLRNRAWLDRVGTLFPKARHFFWMHNMPSKKLFEARPLFAKHRYEIIAVSRFHQQRIQRRLHGNWLQKLLTPQALRWPTIPVHALHNPIDESLVPDNTPVNPHQMILASSPTKGMWMTLKAFEAVLAVYPDYELLIATYSQWDKNQQLPKNVRFLGSLPQHELMQRLRESFCMFYPQSIRCETFGLVYAEANAVGTPALAHDFGAASEVLSDPCQLIDGNHIKTIIDKIGEWRIKRPRLQARPEFRISALKKQWLALLEEK